MWTIMLATEPHFLDSDGLRSLLSWTVLGRQTVSMVWNCVEMKNDRWKGHFCTSADLYICRLDIVLYCFGFCFKWYTVLLDVFRSPLPPRLVRGGTVFFLRSMCSECCMQCDRPVVRFRTTRQKPNSSICFYMYTYICTCYTGHCIHVFNELQERTCFFLYYI